MLSPKELTDAINRINDSTNFLSREIIDLRDQINGARTKLSEREWQDVSNRLTEVAKVLIRIGNDPNDPAPIDLPMD